MVHRSLLFCTIISSFIINSHVRYFSAYFRPASVPVTIPSCGVQRNNISSLSQSPSSPLGSLNHSVFAPHLPHQNKQDQQIEQVRNVSFHWMWKILSRCSMTCVFDGVYFSTVPSLSQTSGQFAWWFHSAGLGNEQTHCVAFGWKCVVYLTKHRIIY